MNSEDIQYLEPLEKAQLLTLLLVSEDEEDER